ncbi:DUF2185 domain-containing protein [Shewanella mangrovisoli]|uniref:DUF2185 domain-containing protein n=1 Tax=Shewanella mangrovisoli TaxID=2864211 RepID=UPI0035B702D0
MKKYKLPNDQIEDLVSMGGCLATDRITVDGCKVGYMYRDKPINIDDSGWRFFAGDEDKDYMADNDNHGVYAVNTIVNYDRDIIGLLNEPIGSEYERDDYTGKFKKAITH